MSTVRNFWWARRSLLALLGLSLGCGRSSLLLDPDETSASGSSTGGAAAFAGSKNSSFGGTFAQSGSPNGGVPNMGFAGLGFGGSFFPVAGFPGGGFPGGGFPGGGETAKDCELAIGDCRSEGEDVCAVERDACEAKVLGSSSFGDAVVNVLDVATSPSGRLLLAGQFTGTLDFGAGVAPLSSIDALGNQRMFAFVASFGANLQAEWAYAQTSDVNTFASGARFTPSGDVVAQGSDGDGAFVVRLDEQGNVVWNKRSLSNVAGPGHVGIDNDGNILLHGTYEGDLDFVGASLSRSRDAGYLIKLDTTGQFSWARSVIPNDWTMAVGINVAVDDEDGISVIGNGQRTDAIGAAFLQKFSSTGELLFSRELSASEGIELRGLAVDRKMRVIVAGAFTGRLAYAGQAFDSGAAHSDVWLAQYSGTGELAWQRSFSSKGKGAWVNTATVDPFGNIVVAGGGSTLTVDGLTPFDWSGMYVLKLRPDSTPVWLRAFDGDRTSTALTSDVQAHLWLVGNFAEQGQLLEFSP